MPIVLQSNSEFTDHRASGLALAGVVIMEVDLRGQDFRGVDFTGAQFQQVNMAGMDLSRSIW